jgi:hypothetical protein
MPDHVSLTALRQSIRVAVGAGTTSAVWEFSIAGNDEPNWKLIVAPEVGGRVLAMSWATPSTLVIATEFGLVVFDLANEQTRP